MRQRRLLILFPILLLVLCTSGAFAQHSQNDTILVGAIVIKGDTIPMVYLNELYVNGERDPKFAEAQKAYNTLRYNVFKVYPYALMAADVLKDVDVNLDKLDRRHDRKQYLKQIEKKLKDRFKGELEDLSIDQGHILFKLIDRQTGKDCYSIIRELKGGFNAVVWQSVALVFSHNLRKEYDPQGEDKDIEKIVLEIEAYYREKYHYQVPGPVVKKG